MNMDIPIRLIASQKEKLSAALQNYPYFREDTVPAKIYGDMVDQRDLPSIGVLEILMCQAGLSEELIYKVMKAIFEHVPELTLMTPIAKYWTAGSTSSAILPYHSGAIKYYKEKNLWTEELEKKQKELLVEVGISK
jgi:TRAP transporter TAXI family solute receptor